MDGWSALNRWIITTVRNEKAEFRSSSVWLGAGFQAEKVDCGVPEGTQENIDLEYEGVKLDRLLPGVRLRWRLPGVLCCGAGSQRTTKM